MPRCLGGKCHRAAPPGVANGNFNINLNQLGWCNASGKNPGQVLHFRDSQMWLTVIHFRRGKSPKVTAEQERAG